MCSIFKGICAVAVAAAVLWGCGDGSDTAPSYVPTPRPLAYPRTPVYEPAYITEKLPGVSFDVNSGAVVDVAPGASAVNVHYPLYDATLYLTVRRGMADSATIEREWERCAQRIDLNLGGAPADAGSFERADGTAAMVVRARSTAQTPVQLIAANGRHGVLLSGAVFMNGWDGPVAYDSVRTVVDALERDVQRLIETLSYADSNN